ncbi:MAG TPA: DNA-directed RNA polymerase subunit alpha C-terminal domain-containing protein [Candidatus Nanoarchaeia archaeon]|nr:DNA-directed RNA polymerase subunit alpha C-terminal domain-containing protein [Candidatus Nanoarchaeia archaeon]
MKEVEAIVAEYGQLVSGKPEGAYLESLLQYYAGGAQGAISKELLDRRIYEIPFSVRVHNGLRNADILYVGELVQQSRTSLLRGPHFGRQSLNQVEEVLHFMGLRLGMEVDYKRPAEAKRVE